MEKSQPTRIAPEIMQASIAKIMAHHSGIQPLEVVNSFVGSEGYRNNIAPLIGELETRIIEEWNRFHEAMVASGGPTRNEASSTVEAPVKQAGQGVGVDRTTPPREKPLGSGSGGTGDSVGARWKQSETQLALTYGGMHEPGASSGEVKTPAGQQQKDMSAGSATRPAAQPQVPKQPKPVESKAEEKKRMVNFAFPNANMGQPYLFVVVPDRPLTGITVKAVVLKGTGLSYVEGRNAVEGVPAQAGEFEVEVLYSVDGGATQSSKSKIVVNADPKSLWKDLPSDKNDPYWKPDEDSKFVSHAGSAWCLIAGSKRGRSHAQTGKFRDDDFFISSLGADGWQIAIVSDGAGSARYSRRGSAIICKQAGEFLERTLGSESGAKLSAAVEAWQAAGLPRGEESKQYMMLRNELYTTLGYAAHHALKSISDECERRKELGGSMKDYSSTVLMSIVRRTGQGIFCATFSVGDGAIGVMRKDGTPEIVCAMDSGEFSGQTRFLSKETVTQEELLGRLRFIVETEFDRMFLMTDGISDPYFQTDTGLQMKERWKQMVADIESAGALDRSNAGSAEKLVTWLDFWSKGEHDDRTLAVIF